MTIGKTLSIVDLARILRCKPLDILDLAERASDPLPIHRIGSLKSAEFWKWYQRQPEFAEREILVAPNDIREIPEKR